MFRGSSTDKGQRSIIEYTDAAETLFSALEAEKKDAPPDETDEFKTRIGTLVKALSVFPTQDAGLAFENRVRKWDLMRFVKEKFPDFQSNVREIMTRFRFGKQPPPLHSTSLTINSCRSLRIQDQCWDIPAQSLALQYHPTEQGCIPAARNK